MNQTRPTIGDNRTGTARAPRLCQEMLEGNREFNPTGKTDGKIVATVRGDYSKAGFVLGSLPPPASVKQVGKSAVKAITGESPNLVIDKLGERLAFERTGVRLYDALISKLQAFGTFDGGPKEADLRRIRDQELQHFQLAKEAMEDLGADPTALTPSADVQATASQGILWVLVDARTNLLQSLEAILTAELTDNDCWEALVELMEGAKEDKRADQFRIALREEAEHLESVRAWIRAGQGRV